jgi:hypothetical protein
MMLNAVRELRLAVRALAKRRGTPPLRCSHWRSALAPTSRSFTVINAVLLRPLPYPDADRIVTIRHHAPGLNLPELQSSPSLIDLYQESSQTLTRVAGYETRQRNLTGSGRPERIRAIAVTPEFFDALAVRPALGRPFYQLDAQQNGGLRVVAPLELVQHRLSEMGHRSLLVTHTLPDRSSVPHA